MCPTSDTVSVALARSLPVPRVVPVVDLSAGARGIGCAYGVGPGGEPDLAIELIVGSIDSSFISEQEARYQRAVAQVSGTITFTPLAGVGAQAVLFESQQTGYPNNNGILATQGTTDLFVAVTPPATVPQLKAFGNQLLTMAGSP